MPFCSLRNLSTEPFTMPTPFTGVVPSGVGIILNCSQSVLLAAMGNLSTAGLDIRALPDDYDGPVSTEFLSAPSRQRLGLWTRDNVAASLTDDPLAFAGLSSAPLSVEIMTSAGSLAGIWANLSETPAGGVLTLTVLTNGAPSAADLVISPGVTQGFIEFAHGEFPFSAGDKIGLAVTTPAGWTSVTLDFVAGVLVEN